MRHSLALFVVMCLFLPQDKAANAEVLTCVVRPLVYSRLPGSTVLFRGDSIMLTIESETNAPVTIIAYAEYKVGPEKWEPIPASKYGKEAGFHSQRRNACVWGKMQSLPANTKITLFLPYRALNFDNGIFEVRYRIQTFTDAAILHEVNTNSMALLWRAPALAYC